MSRAAPCPSPWPCLRIEGHGRETRVSLDCSVSPNAKKTELVGWHDGALRIRLAAPPVDGAANQALRKWLASQLDIAPNRVTLIRGATSRRKQVGIDSGAACVVAWLGRQSALKNGASDPGTT